MTGVAQVHDTTLSPTKIELLRQWLPQQSWFEGNTENIETVANYRFVDPNGQVGIEGLIVRISNDFWHIPLTYRSAPLEKEREVGTLTHGVLGKRWVYFGPDDEVYRQVITKGIQEGHTEADFSDGREKTAYAQGSGGGATDERPSLSTTLRIDDPVDGPLNMTLRWGENKKNKTIINALTCTS